MMYQTMDFQITGFCVVSGMFGSTWSLLLEDFLRRDNLCSDGADPLQATGGAAAFKNCCSET